MRLKSVVIGRDGHWLAVQVAETGWTKGVEHARLIEELVLAGKLSPPVLVMYEEREAETVATGEILQSPLEGKSLQAPVSMADVHELARDLRGRDLNAN